MDNFQDRFERLFQSTPGALCVREFHALKGDEKLPILVVVYPPEIGEHGPICRYTMEGAGLAVDTIMGGPDRLAAIVNTLDAVRTHLEELPDDVTWLGTPRMLDLPKRIPYFGLHFQRHCEEMLDTEYRAAAADMSETKRLWGEAPGKRYEDCEGYRAQATRA